MLETKNQRFAELANTTTPFFHWNSNLWQLSNGSLNHNMINTTYSPKKICFYAPDPSFKVTYESWWILDVSNKLGQIWGFPIKVSHTSINIPHRVFVCLRSNTWFVQKINERIGKYPKIDQNWSYDGIESHIFSLLRTWLVDVYIGECLNKYSFQKPTKTLNLLNETGLLVSFVSGPGPKTTFRLSSEFHQGYAIRR